MENLIPLPPPPPRRNNVLIVVLCLVVGFFALLGIGGYALFSGGTKTYAAAKIPAETFLTALETGDRKTAQAMLGEDVTAESLDDTLDVLQKRHGAPTGHTGPAGFRMSTMNGVSRVQLKYTETFEKGKPVAVLIVLRKSAKTWKVDGFNFQM